MVWGETISLHCAPRRNPRDKYNNLNINLLNFLNHDSSTRNYYRDFN